MPTLRPHQERIIDRMLAYEKGQIIVPTGGGKTMCMIMDTKRSECLFVQPEVALYPHREDIADVCAFAKQMSTLCEFVSESKATTIKKCINSRIREGQTIREDEIAEECDCDINLLRLWKLVSTIKDDLFLFIDEQDDIVCMIGDTSTPHEGYVITNQYGMFKVVDREEFSRANFTMEKTW